MGCFLAPDLLGVSDAPLLYRHSSVSVSTGSSRAGTEVPGAMPGVSPSSATLEMTDVGLPSDRWVQSYPARRETVSLVCCQTPQLCSLAEAYFRRLDALGTMKVM